MPTFTWLWLLSSSDFLFTGCEQETAKHSYRVQELEKELRDREREYEKDLASKEARLMHMEAELRRASEARYAMIPKHHSLKHAWTYCHVKL